MKIKIAAAQLQIHKKIEDNLQEILNAIDIASRNGAQFLCCPEICLVTDERKVKNLSAETAQIKAAAKKNHLNFIFGTYVKEDEVIRNQIWVINNQGKLIYKYNKKHTWLKERPFVKAGRKNKVLEVDGIKFAVINCWDYAYPEDIRKLAKQGAQIIFCPSYLLSHPYTKEVLDKIPQVRAFDAMSYFVMADAVAADTFKRTKICHPLNLISRIQDKPGIIYAELDLMQIDRLRKRFMNF